MIDALMALNALGAAAALLAMRRLVQYARLRRDPGPPVVITNVGRHLFLAGPKTGDPS